MPIGLKTKKHLFFDLDDTVTKSRTEIEKEIYKLYSSLTQDIIIVSGAQLSQMRRQVRDLKCFKLCQNGNETLDEVDNLLWRNVLDDKQSQEIHSHISKLRALHDIKVRDENNLIEHRGPQISYSLIGHDEDITKKKAYDPARIIRLELLKKVPLVSDEIEVQIGGTTCFDYFHKGRHKGYNVERLIEKLGWNKEECVYFGDALFPGCNDESMLGVIDTFPVNDHLHTYEVLKKHFV